RIDSVMWRNLNLTGKLKFGSPVLVFFNCFRNRIDEIDVSKNINLTYLHCGSNNLTELNLSQNIALTFLNCYMNKLTNLDVRKNTMLGYLDCQGNKFTELDFSNNTDLYHLSCRWNNLTELDVRNNLKLDTLDCELNNLIKLDLNDNIRALYCQRNNFKFSTLPIIVLDTFNYSPQATIQGGKKAYTDTVDLSSEYNINGHITTFEWFELIFGKEQQTTQPINNNGVFSFTEAHSSRRLRCKMKNAQFPNLTLVYEIYTENILPKIYHEDCKEDLRAAIREGNWQILKGEYDWNYYGSPNDTIDWYEYEGWVEKIKGVTWIETDSLKRIDTVIWYGISGPDNWLGGKLKFSSPYLVYLNCRYNFINEIDVSKCIRLKYLNCSGNRLDELILNNPELIFLDCSYNRLTELDVSKSINLTFLNCGGSNSYFYSNNNITELDVSNNTELITLNIKANSIEELDLSNNPELTVLNICGNRISELNLSNNTKLKHLSCSSNLLTELNLSNNPELEYIFCPGNNISELILSNSNNPKLNFLNCSNNKLKFSTLLIVNLINGYYYSLQKTINGGEKEYLDTVDLSSEYNINEKITTYEWFDITGGTEQTVEQPTHENGIFTFTEQHNNKRLRCKMRNAQFPALTLVYEVKIKAVNINEASEINFTVFPNPTNDKLTIHHSREIGNIGLYDLSGRLLRSYTVDETVTVLDISDLDNGVYFITVDGKSVKFIKE
ncbi:MAG: T9SS type A sorting domain-containing protein, partial [Firmicutes bacterium]|nr:T9SS type A sorting domain-containing protein [Bacillota bacterium]